MLSKLKQLLISLWFAASIFAALPQQTSAQLPFLPAHFRKSGNLTLDQFSMAGASVWSLKKERTSYAGAAVRVQRASDSFQQDIGFAANGFADLTAYAAFGTGTENVIKEYDQSGNGQDRVIPNANNVKLITSSYSGRPALYGGLKGLGSVAGFTGWNGQAGYTLVFIERMVTSAAGMVYSGGTDQHGSYAGAGSQQFNDNGASGRSLFVDDYAITKAGRLWFFQFDGSGATNALKGRMFVDERELTSSGGSGLGATANSETGLYFNSSSDGTTNARDVENEAVYFLPYVLTSGQKGAIASSVRAQWFKNTHPRLIAYGTSLTVGYPFNATTNAPIEKLAQNLSTITGQTWDVLNLAEVATQTDRILQVQQNEGRYDLDHWRPWDIRIGDAGTNDLGSNVSTATTETRLAALFSEFRAQGIGSTTPVFYRNILKRADDGVAPHGVGMSITYATFTTRSATVNTDTPALLSPDISLVDAAADVRLQDPEDTTIFSDNVHCSILGYTYMESDFESVVRAITGI